MALGKCLILTHPARLGDSVLSLPLHRAVASKGTVSSNIGDPFRFVFDKARVDVAYSGPLYPKGVRALLREARALRTAHFEKVFLVRPNFRSALLTYLARIPLRIGDATEGRGPLLTHRANVPAKANQLVRLESFGACIGLEVPTEFGLPLAPRRDPATVAVVPGTSYTDKMIPPEVLREVCDRLLKAGYRLVLLGGPGEERWADPMRDLPAEDWIGKFTLPDLIEPLSSLSALVAADGGLYHLAVACGVPSVGVYGPTANKYWWHEWGPHVPVLAPGGQMSNVTTDMVWTALEKTLKPAS